MKYPTKSEQKLVVVRDKSHKGRPELSVLLFASVDEFKKFIREKCGCYQKSVDLKSSADSVLQFGIKSRIFSKATAYSEAKKQINLHSDPSEMITVEIGKLSLAELNFLTWQIEEGWPVNSNLPAVKEMFIYRRIKDLKKVGEIDPELGSKTWLEDLARIVGSDTEASFLDALM